MIWRSVAECMRAFSRMVLSIAIQRPDKLGLLQPPPVRLS